MNEMSRRLDYPIAEMLEQVERAERQGQAFTQASARFRQQLDEEAAAAYLAALQALSRELAQLQQELGLGTAQGITHFWHELTKIVTGEDQFVP